MSKCYDCEIRKVYAKKFDMHFDCKECPYDCEKRKDISPCEAFNLIMNEYVKAQEKPHIFRPLAYSIYTVWKKVDRLEKTRVKEEEHEH